MENNTNIKYSLENFLGSLIDDKPPVCIAGKFVRVLSDDGIGLSSIDIEVYTPSDSATYQWYSEGNIITGLTTKHRGFIVTNVVSLENGNEALTLNPRDGVHDITVFNGKCPYFEEGKEILELGQTFLGESSLPKEEPEILPKESAYILFGNCVEWEESSPYAICVFTSLPEYDKIPWDKIPIAEEEQKECYEEIIRGKAPRYDDDVYYLEAVEIIK